jgi:hypothetical protein
LGKTYNERKDAYFARMGFSPRGTTNSCRSRHLHGLFREGAPLAWDDSALERAINEVRAWTTEANGDAAAEDDFSFKYLYDPAPKLAEGGRILFAYMTSDRLFTVPEESRSALDFRWIAHNAAIPVAEGSTYLGLCKKGKAKNAAKLRAVVL